MKIFFDSSSFAKRYVADQHSNEIDDCCEKASSLAVSIICPPEIISALTRLKRESKITERQFIQGKEALLEDLADANICLLNQRVIQKTIYAIESSQLKTMDATHVACALEWSTDLFVTSDKQQYKAANKLGLKSIYI